MLKSINIFEKEGKDKIYCRIREKGDTHSEEAYIFLNRIFSNVSQYIDSDIFKKSPYNFIHVSGKFMGLSTRVCLMKF